MILLQNFYDSFDIREFDFDSFKINKYLSKNYKTEIVKGHFALLSDNLVVFFKQNNELYLKIDNELLKLDISISIRYFEKREVNLSAIKKIFLNYKLSEYKNIFDKYCILEIKKDNILIKKIIYEDRSLKDRRVKGDFTGFFEKENINFGLFISNVFNSTERKDIIYNN